MPYDIALHANRHDIVLEKGELLLIDDKERIAQQAKIRLLTWRNEWFLDGRKGVPYMERVMVKNPNLRHIRQLFIEQLQGIEGVNRIVSLLLSLNAKARMLTVTFELETDYGMITKSEVLGYGR